MLRILFLLWLASVLQGTGLADAGWASRYDPGVMEATVKARRGFGQSLSAPGIGAYIAVRECEHIGRTAWIFVEGMRAPELAMVADCARQDDGDGARSWMAENQVILELDGRSAWRIDFRCLCARRAVLIFTGR